jgi:hypothetical protein
MVIVLAPNKVECQGHGQSWEIGIAYVPVCRLVLMHSSAADFMMWAILDVAPRKKGFMLVLCLTL